MASKADHAKAMYLRGYEGSVGLMVPEFGENNGYIGWIPDVKRPVRYYFNEMSFLDTVRPKITSPDSKIAPEAYREALFGAYDDLRYKGMDLEQHQRRLQRQVEGTFNPSCYLPHDISKGVRPAEMDRMMQDLQDYSSAFSELVANLQTANDEFHVKRRDFNALCEEAEKDAIEGEWFVVKRQRGDEVLLKAAKGACEILTQAFQLAGEHKCHIDVQCNPETMQFSFTSPKKRSPQG